MASSHHHHSPSSTASTIDHSPQNKASLHSSRRPLSPTSLRDVDLSHTEPVSRNPNYPIPPTGHDLMAMFPPPAPDLDTRGSTSGFFQLQERAFFAQAGKEIVRVSVDVDVGQGADDQPKSRSSTNRPWPSPSGTPGSTSQPSSPGPYPHPSLRQHRVNVNPSTYPVPSTPSASQQQPPPQQQQHPPHLHHHPSSSGIRTPPQNVMSTGPPPPIQKSDFVPAPDDFHTDESWRRPIPYAERRRAGKHTRRVLRT